jgi:hypothetical protein
LYPGRMAKGFGEGAGDLVVGGVEVLFGLGHDKKF